MQINLLSFYPFINSVVEILENWWWILAFFILKKPLLFLFWWWRVDIFLSQQKSIILEIKLPKEMAKPIRAMEVVLSSVHAAIYQPPGSLWEKWIDGQVQLSLTIEMISIDGQPHFFVRTPFQYRDAVESSFYAQYPEIEITEVDDYTKYVPQNIPNKDWDLFGCDYKMAKDDYYPIKTYPEFEKEIALEAVEEKKVDPIAALLEGMIKIKKGEQVWVQIILDPIGDADIPKSLSVWLKAGEELRNKLARRPGPPKPPKPIIQEAAEILITGNVEESKKEEKDLIPPEMKLTPGEREALIAIEKKMSKPIFKTNIRFIFLGKRDVWFKPNFRLIFSYFNQYTTNNLNALFPNGKTITKIKKSLFFPVNVKFFYERRKYLRGRKLFRSYVKRLNWFFPNPRGTFMMNTEEIASLFHFPGQKTVPSPGFQRIETKKKGTPLSLPTE